MSLRMLVGMGADPLHTDTTQVRHNMNYHCIILLKGNNALHWAILGGRTGMASWLLTQVFGTSSLFANN